MFSLDDHINTILLLSYKVPAVCSHHLLPNCFDFFLNYSSISFFQGDGGNGKVSFFFGISDKIEAVFHFSWRHNRLSFRSDALTGNKSM